MGEISALYLSMLENMPDPAILIAEDSSHDLSATILAASPATVALRPYSQLDFSEGLAISQAFPASLADDLKTFFRTRKNIDICLYEDQEASVWYMLSLQILPDDGAFGQNLLLLRFHNISDRKHTEADLRRRSAMLSTLIEALPDDIYMKDADSRFLVLNSATAKTLGCGSPSKALYRRDADFFPAPYADEFRKDELRLLKSGTPIIAKEERIWQGQDEEYWLSTTKVPLHDDNGRVTGLVGIGRDISSKKRQEQKLKQAEELLRLTTSVSPILVAYLDNNLKLRFANPVCARWWMLKQSDLANTSEEDLPSLADLLDLQSFNKLKPMIQKALSGEKVMQEMQETLPDGQERWLGVTLHPRWSESGVAGFHLFAVDLTEQHRAKKEAEFSSRAKSEFLANMSHELRTPLNAILGFSEIMRSQAFGQLGNSRYVEYSHDIHESGRHLLDLINDILDLSKIEAGKMEIDALELSSAEVTDTCLRLIQPRSDEKQITLVADLPEEMPYLIGDRRAIKQILLNLLSNAVKFTPEQGNVTLQAQTNEKYLFIKILDTGCGMSPEELECVGEPFRQFHNSETTKNAGKGTGIGLHITKSLIELMQGTMDIQSTQGKGTCVTVSFPLAEQELLETATPISTQKLA